MSGSSRLEEIRSRWSVPPLDAYPPLVAVAAGEDIAYLLDVVDRLHSALGWYSGDVINPGPGAAQEALKELEGE